MKNSRLGDEKRVKWNVLGFGVIFFWSFFGYGQTKESDSIWISIYKIDSNKVTYKVEGVPYNELYYRNIQVPIYDTIENGYALIPLDHDIESLLKQTQLDNSYSVSEVKGTALENSLRQAEKLSYPFASSITSKLATKLNLTHNKPILVAKEERLYQLASVDSSVISTSTMLGLVHDDVAAEFDQQAYLRFRLLSFLVGSSNMHPDQYSWKELRENDKRMLVPYTNSYQNEYMNFDGTYKLIAKLVSSYQHFEPYSSRIKNIKKASHQFRGFDVNLLSSLPYEKWEDEVAVIQHALNSSVLEEIKNSLPKGVLSTETEMLFEVLNNRITSLDAIAARYYNLISPHKIVVGTNKNNLIDVRRKEKSTAIEIYNEKDGKKVPIKAFDFLNKETDEIWIYGLKGNDYFEVSGKSKHPIPLNLIGGNNADKYEIQNGTKVVIHDSKSQTFIVEKDKAKVSLSEEKYVTQYNSKKYKHALNKVQPKFGANPDDGLFIGVVDTYKVMDFDQNPYTKLHQVSANLYLGTLGFKVGYYGELANVYKGFNAFVGLGYQSSNYSTNFFGFGNETPNIDDNLTLNYNRIRIATFDAKIGLLKRHKNYFVSANLFFESKKIDETPDRFVSSETLFFPEADFFERKNYLGLSGVYEYKDLTISIVDDLKILPKIEFKLAADINEFSKTNVSVYPSLYVAHPMYGDKISVDATFAYQHIFGNDIPFYQAANLGGSTGIRGYRNERFTGQSLCYVSTNLRWHIKDLKSEVLPLQFGLLGGFDAGRVWQENETSSQIHSDFGAGFWLQTADLIKAELQGFKGDEGLRFSFNIAIGF